MVKERRGHRGPAPIWSVAILLLTAMSALLGAVEVHLVLPDPLVPRVAIDGELDVINPPAGIAAVDLPPVPGLRWALGSGSMQQTQIVNGKTTTTVSLPIRLTADHVGILNLGAVTVHLEDGSTVVTPARTLRVANGDPSLIGDVTAAVTFEPSRIVAGEPTVMCSRLWVRGNASVVQALDLRPPPGVDRLGKPSVETGSTYDQSGNRWQVFTTRWPITCSHPGEVTGGGGQSSYVVNEDAFPFPRNIQHDVAVKPGRLIVEALPTANRPRDFMGLIGPVTLTARCDRYRIAVGEGTTLTVVVRGLQIGLAARPTLGPIPGLQVYPRAESGASTASTSERRFSWDLVPSAAGTYHIPVFSESYFDPTSRTYERARSASLVLTVIPGRSPRLTIVGNPGDEAEAGPEAKRVPIAATLPPPMHGSAPLPTPMRGWAALSLGMVLGLIMGGWTRWLAHPLPRAHRRHAGQALSMAVAAGDLSAIALALHTLAPRVRTDEERQASQAFASAVDLARFGGVALTGPVATWLRVLQEVP